MQRLTKHKIAKEEEEVDNSEVFWSSCETQEEEREQGWSVQPTAVHKETRKNSGKPGMMAGRFEESNKAIWQI